MIDNNTNPHTIYRPGYTVSHYIYKNNAAVGVNDEWDYAVFQHAGGFGGEYKVTETVKYDRLRSLLESVYKAGVFQAKKEIREVLGVRD